MKIRRFLTIAGLGLAVIRPARADEPGVVRVRYSADPVRAASQATRPVLVDRPIRPPSPSTGLTDPSIGPVTSRMVADAPPPQTAPSKGTGLQPIPGSTAPQVPGGATPQAPGVLPGIPSPPEIPGPVDPTLPPPPPGSIEPMPPPEGAPIVPPPTVLEPVEAVPPIPGAEPLDLPPPEFPPPGGVPTDIPQPVVPEAIPIPPAAEAIPADAFTGDVGAGAAASTMSLSSLAAQGTFATPEVFGDSLGRSRLQFFQTTQTTPNPPPPLPRPPVPPRPPSPFDPIRTAALVPSIRSIKLSENQSPAPRDRLIYQFNFYDDVNGSVNERFLSPISNVRVYRHIFGFEKTFFDRMMSLGMRLPLNTVNGDSPLPNVGQTETAVGNLEIFGKFVLYSDDAGRLLSTGLSVSPATGPSRFAGASYLEPLNNTTIQPFIGGIYRSGRAFFQGFFSIEVPFNPNDVTLLYNDYAIGYFLYESARPDQFITAVVPTFEVHVNTPLNHRGIRLDDPAGTPDFVNLTYGTALQFGQRARLLGALVTPVTGPRPFDLEVIAALNVYY